LATALSLAMSVDLLFNHALIDAIRAVLRMRSFEFGKATCFSQCHVPELLFLWLFYACIAWFIQNSLNGQLVKWMRSGVQPTMYQPLSSDKVTTRGPEAKQKTFSYPGKQPCVHPFLAARRGKLTQAVPNHPKPVLI
jgi:hypothetical protein